MDTSLLQEQAALLPEDVDINLSADRSSLQEELPLMNTSVPNSRDGFAQGSEAAEEEHVPERWLQDETLDCWTQNRSTMAGAPPCGAEGEVEGNAKVQLQQPSGSSVPVHTSALLTPTSVYQSKKRPCMLVPPGCGCVPCPALDLLCLQACRSPS